MFPEPEAVKRPSHAGPTAITSAIDTGCDACDHCGLPAPRRLANNRTFCCNGCRGAYQLIHQWGLEDYYALRDRTAGGVMSGEAVAVAGTPQRFAELDDPNLLSDSAPREVGGGMVRSRLAVSGVHCGACSWLIERSASMVPGWQAARVSMHDHSVEVTYDPEQTKLSKIAEVLGRMGYGLSPWVVGEAAARFADENRQQLMRIALAGFCAMNAMWIAIAIYAGEHSGISDDHAALLRWVGVALGAVAVLFPGRPFLRGAWASLRTRTTHMDLPIAIGLSVGAVSGVISLIVGHTDVYFDSVAVLVFLLLVGRWIQFRQQHRAADAVALLMRVTPRTATRITNDEAMVRVLADQLVVGDRVHVAAGEGVAADGVVVTGRSSIDRSLLTGESQSITVGPGDAIQAGVLNHQSPLEIRVTAGGDQSRAARLMRLVEEASLKKTPIVQLADAIAGRFVIVILTLAAITLALWWSSGPLQAAGHTTALLIVACPCALALATPLAIAVTLGRAAQRGLLIRGGDCLERLARPGMIWFDKTGTLTEGKPRWLLGEIADDDLALAAALERDSRHPISLALVDQAVRRGLSSRIARHQVRDVIETVGGGIRGTVDGRSVAVGNLAYIRGLGGEATDDVIRQVAEIADQAITPIVVKIDDTVVSIVGMGDRIRDDAVATTRRLRSMGWGIGILSGDHPRVVSITGGLLNISPHLTHGGLDPESKFALIERSKAEGSVTVMVGDGVNDAAALAAADVGIAVRGGAEASLQAAPIFLASGALQGLVDLIDASQQTVRVIRRNFRISLAYNAIAVTLAMTGWISPLLAAVLMPISSLSVLALTLGSRTFRLVPRPAASDAASSDIDFSDLVSDPGPTQWVPQ